MRVLLINTASLSAILHTLPALTDAAQVIPDIRFDWVVDEACVEVPAWHNRVERVIPVSLRRWQHAVTRAWWHQEWKQFRKALDEQDYYAVIDAQGDRHSAYLCQFARCPSYGFDSRSAATASASRFYQHGIAVERYQHAVERRRQLFARALGYDLVSPVIDAGIDVSRLPEVPLDSRPYLMFLHGARWATRQWPVFYWQQLIQLAVKAGFAVRLTWASESEREQAHAIAGENPLVDVLPHADLSTLASWIRHAQGVVAVDNGVAHIAAALNVPTVSLYGPTDPGLKGAYGKNQVHLYANYECAPCLKPTCGYQGPRVKNQLIIGQGEYVEPPCFSSLMPGYVFQTLRELMNPPR